MARGAEQRRAGEAALEVERERSVYVGVVDWRKAGDLDGSEVAMISAAHAHIAVARGSASSLEWQCRDVGLRLCGRIEAVNVVAARVVDDVLLRGAYEVPQLVVCDRDLGGIVRLGGQHEGICVSTPAAVSALCSADVAEGCTRSRQRPCFAVRWAAACLCSRGRRPEISHSPVEDELYVTRGTLGYDGSWRGRRQ